jgi:hypothetical protein
MATLLREIDPNSASADAEPPKAPMKNQHAPMRPTLAVKPARYVVREISFLMDSDGLQFLYKDSTTGREIPEPDGIESVVPQLTATTFPASLGLTGAGLTTAETPLDLALEGGGGNGKGPAFLVFKLDPRLNWRFSRTEPAVTLKDAGHDQFYGGLTYVDADGRNHESPLEECRLVFFKADPPAGSYRHGLNFNVELIQKAHLGDDEPRVLPITIDPDIRFPGGSTT